MYHVQIRHMIQFHIRQSYQHVDSRALLISHISFIDTSVRNYSTLVILCQFSIREFNFLFRNLRNILYKKEKQLTYHTIFVISKLYLSLLFFIFKYKYFTDNIIQYQNDNLRCQFHKHTVSM